MKKQVNSIVASQSRFTRLHHERVLRSAFRSHMQEPAASERRVKSVIVSQNSYPGDAILLEGIGCAAK
eukprot:5563615-Pleurochrysis_carterae.AAC.2